jgi:hypothetical protein
MNKTRNNYVGKTVKYAYQEWLYPEDTAFCYSQKVERKTEHLTVNEYGKPLGFRLETVRQNSFSMRV